jgi:hypothetical protein
MIERNDRMKRSINIVLMLLNVVGIFFYLKNASLSWAIGHSHG